MKKFLALTIALVMMLALAAPAMAFTSDTKAEDEPYELDIYLVEYEDNDFFGITTLPESDRGYAKNEIVAAVVEVFVPEGEDLDADYENLILDGENVSLNVTENDITAGVATLRSTLTAAGTDFAYAAATGLTLADLAALDDPDDDMTTKFLFFAKVTDDEALLSATLDADDVELVAGTDYDVLDGDYDVNYTAYVDATDTDGSFAVSDDADLLLFTIFVNEDDETTGLTIHSTLDYAVVALANDTLGFIIPSGAGAGTLVDDDSDLYDDLMEIYEEVFVEDFGFDFDLLGGVVDVDFFEGLNSSDDIEATVDIAPWTAYVTVPDNIVVDPPKTGDAASILGFVMIVLAAAAVVAVRKVRA